ncbi:polysaccharide lyase family 8 super-sandwich domain-containing protein [Paenibacillus lautus]|uniref:polysaccharide lyase family 8 super-sandwich domain-containing protein n=1 Tax=Paenibacillus TaxID=44249 RepID=UPI002DB94C7D|nr:polysaccharide lyase family 8 super-sandwich domain-containing protein [Paenibacillus lautus]MEC0256568.1 polysaccharide lyase family 8 super-sandwich domain-containing protein [Paenibacillus lautus]
MSLRWRKFTVVSLLTSLVLYPILLFAGPVQASTAADEYDLLRERWHVYLTGGTAIDTSDPEIAAKISLIETNANKYWAAMNKSAGRTYLWSDLANWSVSSTISSNYVRLKEMALAYATTGSSLKGNEQLAADILSGLDWMYANKYNETKGETGNWWDWEIGVPMNLTDAMILIYDQMSATQKTNYTKALDKFVPDPTYRTNSPSLQETGANRLDKALIVSLRGVLNKTDAKMAQGRDAISQVLLYVQSRDGFYEDGSFIQHDYVAYTGSYGAVLLEDMAKLLYLLGGSSWDVTDPNIANVIRWVTEAYRPFLYKGAMMDTVRGRAISREASQDHQAGRKILASLVMLADGLNARDAATVRQIAKGQMMSDTTFPSYTEGLSIFSIGKIKALLDDPSVEPAGDMIDTHVFAGMDRAVHLRPEFGLALGLFSTRISAFEYGNGENTKPWWQGAGAVYLYNTDQTQFSGAYWPTINPVRLPGTTTDGSTGSVGSFSFKFNTSNWVGGSSIDGPYGTVGMEFSMSKNTGTPLSGKKSWFLFGDKYIALGSDISSTGGRAVETIVENRKLNESGSNTLTVDGTAKPSTTGWTEAMTGVQWAHLSGSVPGSDIAYVFPGGATVRGLRETRSGSWKDINTDGSDKMVSAQYASLALNHGVDPVQASYAYAVYPGASTTEAADYAADPSFTVLKNTGNVQAVMDTTDQMAVGANFWTDSVETVQVNGADYLTSNKKASVTIAENGNELQIGVSDPTKANGGTIEVELHRATTGALLLDPGVTVKQFSPTTILEVNTAGAIGKTFLAKLSTGSTTPPAAPQLIEALPGPGSAALKWNASTGATGYRIYYGTAPGSYTKTVDISAVSGNNQYTVTDLSSGTTYYFAIKALNSTGMESAGSNELSVTLGYAISPSDDAYVRSGSYANSTFGSSDQLVVKNDPNSGYHRYSYLKFDLSQLPEQVKSAQIRLVPTSAGLANTKGVAYEVSNHTWTENGMTWNNKPAAGSLIGNWTVPAAGTPVTIDVTAQVNAALVGKRMIAVQLAQTANYGSNGWIIYGSKEHTDAAYRPVLLFERQDTVPPDTIASLSPEQPDGHNGWYVHPVTLSLASKDQLSGVTESVYSLDGGSSWQTYNGPVTFSQDGKYTISYQSRDDAGNTEPKKTITFSLDTEAPLIIVGDPAAESYSMDQDLLPQFVVNDDLSGVDQSKTTLLLDGQPLEHGATIPLYTLSLGSHSLEITGYDSAGNIGRASVDFQTTATSESLQALVARFEKDGWIDNNGIANSLRQKLDKGELNSFIHEIQAQSGKHVHSDAARYLLQHAQALI